MDAELKKRLHGSGELIRCDEIGSCGRIREPCVGLGDQGKVRPLAHLLYQGEYLLRTQRAVDSYGICTKTLQRDRHARDRCPRECAPVLLEAHRDPDGEGGVLLCRKKGGSCLLEVREGLKDNKVCSCFLTGCHHLPEDVICLVKGKSAERGEKLSDRTYVQGNLCAWGSRCSSSGYVDVCLDDRTDAVNRALELSSVRTECVRVKDAAAGSDIVALDLLNCLGIGQGKKLRLLSRSEPAALEHCPHSSV